jgi:hypothetical protein
MISSLKLRLIWGGNKRMENGRWKIENGKLKMEDGKWKGGNKKRVVNGPLEAG